MHDETIQPMLAELATKIAEALTLADLLKLHDVKAHLDAALVKLTGQGMSPAWHDQKAG